MSSLPPIERSITVSWTPVEAFRRFVHDFAAWWPSATHSIGGPRLARVVFEPRVGGLIFEEHVDGRRFHWGQVTALDEPRRIEFTWHPARDPATAQAVVLTFTPGPTGTLVKLTSSNWERWGDGASRARRGYDLGWGHILNRWAGRTTAGMVAVGLLMRAVSAVMRWSGRSAVSIERAGGELPRVSRP